MRGWIAFALLLAACGVKAPPTPPDLIVPEAPGDLRAIVREGRLYLSWGLPKKNVDGSKPADIVEFEILRGEGSCPRCPISLSPWREIEVPEGKEAFLWEDTHLEAGMTYRYRVRGVNHWGFAGPPSNEVRVTWIAPPPPPRGVFAKGDDRRVYLHWEGIKGAWGYHVYRREEGEGYPLEPVGRVKGEEEFADRGVLNGKRYFYVVRTLARSGETLIEGGSSEEVTVIPEDLTPPSPPVGLVAFLKEGTVELDWFPSEEEDVLGYYVYRKGCEELRFERLNSFPLKETAYSDRPPSKGCYVYAVGAVDNSLRRNEGPLSRWVRVEIR